MFFAHMTLPTPRVQDTASFLERTFGFPRNPVPRNSPVETVWLNVGRGQELHVTFVSDFHTSRFEAEFGRHLAVFVPLAEFEGLKARVVAAGGTLVTPLRTTPFERFFFREPINGYIFEVIDEAHAANIAAS
jgi:hypothetical protein